MGFYSWCGDLESSLTNLKCCDVIARPVYTFNQDFLDIMDHLQLIFKKGVQNG